MNAALLMMSTALMTGADVAPAAPPASVVLVGHAAPAGCSDCAAPPVDSCDTCGKASLLDRLRAKFKSFGGKHKGGDSCDTCALPPAPAPCAVPAPCDTCSDPCGGHKAGFLDRLKGRFAGKHKSAGCDTCAAADGCALPAAPVPAGPATAPAEAPKEMPKPPAVTPTPKTTSITLPIPVAPVTPVSGPKLSGTTNPF